jgi:hypothetical protein
LASRPAGLSQAMRGKAIRKRGPPCSAKIAANEHALFGYALPASGLVERIA